MLHELLLSLIGQTGQIIIPGDGCFKIDPYIDFISDPEKDILNKICALGYHYSKIEKFLEENHKIFSDIGLQLITDVRNGEEAEYVSDNTNPIGNSAYVKAFCYGAEEIMEEYKENVMDIERTFLKERVFTLSSLSVKLSDYFYMLPEINYLIDKILTDNCTGGQVIDLLQMRLLTGHTVLQDMYKRILKYTYKVLFHQIIAWIVYGKLLDFYNEFFIYRVENKKADSLNKGFEIQFKENKPENQASVLGEKLESRTKGHDLEADWDSVFSLRLSMLPQTILSIKLAENILFIGKAQRVLQAKNKALKNFSIESLKILQQLSSADIIDTLLFQNTIEKIRFDVAQKMMDLTLKEEKLMDHLKNLKDFYFLAKGEFYQIFIEESRNLMKLPPTPNAEHEINGVAYQNAIVRLNWDDSQLLKDVKFKMTNNGFEFSQFSSLYGLNIVGNISQKKNHNYIRFEQMKTPKEGGCMWYNLKQSVENGFKMSFSVRFKRAIASQLQEIARKPVELASVRKPNLGDVFSPYKMNLESPPKKSLGKEDITSQTSIFIVIQNDKEISSWKKNAPLRLEELNEYVAIKINLTDTSNKQTLNFSNDNYRSSIGVYHFSKERGFKLNNLFQEKIGAAPAINFVKESKLDEVNFNKEDVNFAEEDLHMFQISYDGEYLQIVKEDYRPAAQQSMESESHQQCLRIPLKVAQLLNLDMGRAYVGFVQESQNSRFFVDILSWKMLGYNIYNSEDTWNGLTVAYNVKWPVNLFLSSQVMEKYSNIFRFLFPIRIIQTDLHQTWLHLVKKNKNNQFDRIYVKLLHLRNKMSFFIDNLWSYFHLDVLGAQWAKLEEFISQAKDFDEMRKVHEMYLTSISSQTFLNFPKMVKGIYLIVKYCKKLVDLVARTEIEVTLDEMKLEYVKINKDYEQAVADMIGIIAILNKTHSSPYLYQLLLKLDFNNYYSSTTNVLNN